MIGELIGRQREQAELRRLVDEAVEGEGGIVLLAGEAGMGKTHLAEDSLALDGVQIFEAGTSEATTPPYGPVVAILRSWLRRSPQGLEPCGPIAQYLRLLLPELGPAPPEADQAALLEALRCAFQEMGREQPTIVVLDDLQWADNATLELLPELGNSVQDRSLLIVGIYRSDEIPRGHPVRHVRNELRRDRRLREISLPPLDRDATAALAERILGGPASEALASTLYDRTLGVPLFVEELAKALVETGRLRQSPEGFGLAQGEQIPVPESVRDAVLLRLDRLSAESREVLEVAAAVGFRFDLELVEQLTHGKSGLAPVLEHGLIQETGAGEGVFHHALTREAIYKEIAWSRRRRLHRQIAEQLEQEGAPSEILAEHWLAAGERSHARLALLEVVSDSCSVHAYRDALKAGERALELWPENELEMDRLAVLDRLGHCAQMSGLPAEAARSWREVAEGRREAQDLQGMAQAERRLATAYELQGSWGRALAARQAAAEAFAACDMPGEASTEYFTQAAHLSTAGSFKAALELADLAINQAEQASRVDLHVRALGLKGNLLAKLGEIEAGREMVQSALSLALRENLIAPAAEVYQRLASVMEQASDYAAAREVYNTAVNYCEQSGQELMGQVCLACLTIVLRQTGEWLQAKKICREVLSSAESPPTVRAIAACQLGLIHAYRGEVKQARSLLQAAVAQGRGSELAAVEIDSLWGLAMLDDLERSPDSASDQIHFLLHRWERTEDRHYAVPSLRWSSSFFADQGEENAVKTCAETLSHIATETGNPEALAALAHALGESAILYGDARSAVEQFAQALELLQQLELPYERAQTQVRSGLALAAAGKEQEAMATLANAQQTARNLGARPLAARAANELAKLERSVGQQRGEGRTGKLRQAALTRRQQEVLRLVAEGMTNKEVAQQLVLSPRTVDMHVGNILDRLDCRSRTDAVRKASELGLLD